MLQAAVLVPRTVEFLLELAESLEDLAGLLRCEGRLPLGMILECILELQETHVALASRGRGTPERPYGAEESEVRRFTKVNGYDPRTGRSAESGLSSKVPALASCSN